MSAVTWRNLSVPQRKALRHLNQVESAAVGWDQAISQRLAKNLVQLGVAALASGSRADCRSWYYWPRGTKICITAAGRAAVPAIAESAAVAAVARSSSKVPQPAAVATRTRSKVPQRRRGRA